MNDIKKKKDVEKAEYKQNINLKVEKIYQKITEEIIDLKKITGKCLGWEKTKTLDLPNIIDMMIQIY